MQFCHVTLAVENLETSLAFYCDIVGLKLKQRLSVGAGTEIAFLGDNAELELISGSMGICKEGQQKGNGVSVGFFTESLEDMIILLREKAYEVDGEIICPNPSVRFFFAKDPDGYTVQFMQRNT